MGTAMSIKFEPPCTNFCWVVRKSRFIFSWTTKILFSWWLFKTYMDDGFLPCNSTLDLNVLKNVLNNLHQNIKFTVQLAKFGNFSKPLVINFIVWKWLFGNRYIL